MPRVYDCFMFRDEFDFLEIRMQHLKDVVDVFVAVEADRTHSGKSRRYVLSEDLGCRVVRVKLKPGKGNELDWKREHRQRNAIWGGLWGIRPDDVVMVSDIDEIPRAEAVSAVAASITDKPVVFEQILSYYNVNQICHTSSSELITWYGTKAVRKSELKDAQTLRDMKASECVLAAPCDSRGCTGWHFSFCGNTELIQRKLQSTAHQEHNKPNITFQGHIDLCVKEGRDLVGADDWRTKTVPLVRGDFPDYLVDNQKKFKHLIADWE